MSLNLSPCRHKYNVVANWLSPSPHDGSLKPATHDHWLGAASGTGWMPPEVALRRGKGRHIPLQAKMYVYSAQVDMKRNTSCIFDSLDSQLWDILGSKTSDATVNVPALSVRLHCGVSDWIWEDICTRHDHWVWVNVFLNSQQFLYYTMIFCLFRF